MKREKRERKCAAVMSGWYQVNRSKQKTSCRWKIARSWWHVEVRKMTKRFSQMDLPPFLPPPPSRSSSPSALSFFLSQFSAPPTSSFSGSLRLRYMFSLLTAALRHLPQGLPSELQPQPCSNKTSVSVICHPKIPPQSHMLIVFHTQCVYTRGGMQSQYF